MSSFLETKMLILPTLACFIFLVAISSSQSLALDKIVFTEFGLFENLSIFFATLSVHYLISIFRRTKDKSCLYFIVPFIFYIGEEISWGFHFLGDSVDYSFFTTKSNMQKEPNIHNISIGSYTIDDLMCAGFLLAILSALVLKPKYFKKKVCLGILISMSVFLFVSHQNWNTPILAGLINYIDELNELLLSIFMYSNFRDIYNSTDSALAG